MLLEPSIASLEEHLAPNGRPVLYLRLLSMVLRSPSGFQKPLDTGISEVLQTKNLSIEQIKPGNSRHKLRWECSGHFARCESS